MDPLSQVIGQSKPKSIAVGATDVGGDIAIGFPAHDGAYFYSVASGDCWLEMDGASPLRLHAGDCVVLPSGRPFRLSSEIGLPPTDAAVVFGGRPNGSIAAYNGGGRCMMFAAHFEFDRGFSSFLLSVLEVVVRIHEPAAKAALRNAIDQMIDELQRGEPGSAMVVEHLAQIALIKTLRFHLSEVAHARPGWLYALADRRLGKAIAAMHATPSHRWNLSLLAGVCAMSRTVFAIRFKAKVGMTPMDYLLQLRMRVAAERLLEPGARVAVVAQEIGYESESAFNVAFKRQMGLPPRRYAETARNGALCVLEDVQR
jgi:AraC-like DNA-binding protein